MINDYKSRTDYLIPPRRHGRRSARLFAILGLTLGATALYATFGNFSASLQTGTIDSQVTTAITASPDASEPEAQTLTKLPLPLPGQTAEQRDNIAIKATLPATAQVTESAEFSAAETSAANDVFTTPSDSGDPATTAPIAQISGHTDAEQTATNIDLTADEPEIMAAADHGTWHEEQVKRGDSLARIFSRLKLSPSLLHRIVNSSKEAKSLADIRPGETIKVRLDRQGELLELVHKQSEIRSLQILPVDESFTAQVKDRSLEKRIATASGTITNSLYLGAQRAGLSDSLTMELANIFGWDIDFALEIRAGDQFSLIYEEEYLDGKKYRNGPILAAEFVNQGKIFRAIRFEDDEGYSSYYSPEGESMRKAFLRAPVDFRRISSRFTKARYHPVLGKKRPHKGVDYAAAIGTPIKASGDGRVTFRGTKGGYGRTVMIRHGSQYTTLYAHMSKFRGSVKNGSRVRQGQVIGYVGKSGLATGPHLHYEFRVNGVHRNPLTIKLPAAEPLAKKYRSKFTEITSHLLAELDLISKTMVADAR